MSAPPASHQISRVTLLARARELADKAKTVATTEQACAVSTLNQALKDSAESLAKYQQLLGLYQRAQDAPHQADLKREMSQVLANGFQLLEKKRRCQSRLTSVEPAEIPPGLFPAAAAPPQTVGQVQFSGADAALLSTIRAGIVQNFCQLMSFDQLIDSAAIEQTIQRDIVDRLAFEQFRSQSRPVSILLYGPNGTGKSKIAEAIARKLFPVYSLIFISLSASDLRGTGARGIKVLFTVARELTKGGRKGGQKVLLFVDDFDQLLVNAETSSALANELTSKTTASISGVPSTFNNSGIVFVACTNNPDLIPDSIFKTFTHKIYVGLPTQTQIRSLLLHKLKRLGWDRVNFWLPPGQAGANWAAYNSLAWDREVYVESAKAGTSQRDFLDLLSWWAHAGFYSHRDLMFLWDKAMMLAEDRAVKFASGPATAMTKVYWQKWLLERSTTEELVQEGSQCVLRQTGVKYSYIPLYYTAAPSDGGIATEEQLEKQFLRIPQPLPLGNVWGLVQRRNAAGAGLTIKPKFSLKDRQKEVKVVVTRATITDVLPVAEQLGTIPITPAAASSMISIQTVRRQTEEPPIPPALKNIPVGSAGDLGIYTPPFVPTRPWSAPAEEQYTPDKLAPSQLIQSDFVQDVQTALVATSESVTTQNPLGAIMYVPNTSVFAVQATRSPAPTLTYGESAEDTRRRVAASPVSSIVSAREEEARLRAAGGGRRLGVTEGEGLQQQQRIISALQQFAKAISDIPGVSTATTTAATAGGGGLSTTA